MSLQTNIAAQTSQPAVAGPGGVASSGNANDPNLGTLFATLLSLTAPGQAAKTTKVSGESATEQPGLAGISAGLAGLLLNPEVETSQTTPLPEADQALVDLLAALQALEKTLQGGGPVDQDVLDNATSALAAFSATLEPSTLPAPAINGETKTPPVGASAASHATASPEAPPAEKFTTQQPVIPQQASGNANEATREAGRQALDVPTAAREAVAAKITQVADKLEGLAKNAPELAEHLRQIASKISELASSKGTAASSATPTPQTGTEALQAVAALIGAKETNSTKSAPAITPMVSDIEAEPELRTQLTPSTSDKSKTDSAQTNSVGDNSTPSRLEAKVNLAAIAGNVNVAANANTDAGLQTDPLLTVQSNGQQTMNGQPVTTVKTATAPYQQAGTNLNLPHIAYEFARNLRTGASRFQIQLDPPHMGRIDVKMDIDSSGTLNARLTVERADTLDYLQRDARALERALSQAGLDSSRTNLEFSLKQNPFSRQDGQFANGQDNPDNSRFADGDISDANGQTDTAGSIIYNGTASPGGVNMLA